MLLDHAKIMPYYFYMCDMIPNAEHWRTSVAEAQDLQYALLGYMPGFATPRVVCDVPFVGKRWVHMLKDYDRVKGISYWTKNYRTGHRGRRPRRAHAPVPVLRPDLHAAGGGAAVVARGSGEPRRGVAPRLSSSAVQDLAERVRPGLLLFLRQHLVRLQVARACRRSGTRAGSRPGTSGTRDRRPSSPPRHAGARGPGPRARASRTPPTR